MSNPDTVEIPLADGSRMRVERFAEFDYTVQGETFRFWVTLSPVDMTKHVTHAESGMRVCTLGARARHLAAYSRLDNDEARARFALDRLVERVGEARVRSALAGARAA